MDFWDIFGAETLWITPQLALVPATTEHAPPVYAQIQANRDYLSQYLHWPRFVQGLSDTEKFFKNEAAKRTQGKSAVNVILCEGEVAGLVSFNEIDKQKQEALIGYWLAPAFQGKGVATRAVTALCQHGMAAGIKRCIIRCAAQNERSQGVAQRAGFKFECLRPQAEQIGEKVYDQHEYVLIAETQK
eukprot:Gregarina_sp_Poly_1__3741@NODE_2107_length_2677_cov_74_206130_g614_i1_p2_GENE_NODE_2107_length_2677_cov_74_206130_g614_i1NODE_2107_length_2677_cov_74_206130_g614_i1_p2_ORF_typecomplete_len187_score28_00Acetyltransf_3/PF13302_7/6_9e25Acetyltransf_1/PF00583_25/4_3e12GNAT_acetyltran/PF12746_7/8_7e12Acetyltransf_4/PF13420_7/2_4e11FR47/PF08445_10/1e07Acetyltransf_10/PF13673_7/8_5e07Acetyltransf_8/PF13523_6/1_9e05Acetyltransf_7/PF13508_7/0_00096Acetyltransf_9/PF13527_7/0_02Gly_acyl_tr_C/PF08444_10/6_6